MTIEGSELHRLTQLQLGELRDAWLERFGQPAPAYQSRLLLFHAFAYRIQARQTGDLSAKLKKQLHKHAREFENDPRYVPAEPDTLQHGTVLIRDWNGRRYGVTVTESGFLFEGTTYASLTKITRIITGSPRSGPLFFKTGSYRIAEIESAP